jgi:hypothetical protein
LPGSKEERDMGRILSLTRKLNPYVRLPAQEEEKYEAEEVEKENPAARKTNARGAGKTGELKTQIAAGRNSKSAESGEEISRPRYCLDWKEVSEAEKKAESLARTSCATRSGDEGPMGCKESRRGHYDNVLGSQFADTANSTIGQQSRRHVRTVSGISIDIGKAPESSRHIVPSPLEPSLSVNFLVGATEARANHGCFSSQSF